MRDSILTAAFRMFGERGFGGTTIKDLAQSLDISPGSVYTYFSGKEELFRCTVEEGWQRFLLEISRIVTAPKELKERFDSILDYCFESLKQALPLLRGMLFDSRQRRLLHENLQLLCQLLEQLIREGQSQGLIRIVLAEEHVRAQIKINVFGVLSSVALAQDETLDREIDVVKSAVKHLLYQRLKLEDTG
ncbi:MAG: TetR/AcrR family transcriptional regulator [Spirochaetaceae bacterium]|nr:MAG: TetR/AcrR family transcriptional regulator [Spirochaetaceae bacterium]